MSANIEAKKVVVEEIKKNASEAKSIVLVNYQTPNSEGNSAIKTWFTKY